MFKNDPNNISVAKQILDEIGDHALTKSHSRHLSSKRCMDIGLKIIDLEDDQKLQEKVLSVHHSCIHTLSSTAAFKIIENQNSVAFIQVAKQVIIQS